MLTSSIKNKKKRFYFTCIYSLTLFLFYVDPSFLRSKILLLKLLDRKSTGDNLPQFLFA